MRFMLAGILLVGLSATSALGQAGAEGEVESIGFDGNYRPNCWTPIKLKLSPLTGAPRTYRIAVAQEDLDKDKVTYSRPFTLSGNPEGQKIEERVWAYYRPQPFDHTAENLKIFLYNEKGEQEVIVRVPPNTMLRTLDEERERPGRRLVLLVCTSQSSPMDPYLDGPVVAQNRPDRGEPPRGMNEDVQFQKIRPSDIPGDAKGLEAVDAIVWLDSDPTQLAPESQSAIEDWVRDGGHLVVCQSADWLKTKASFLNALLPVTIESMGEEQGLKSLNNLVLNTLRDQQRERDWFDFPEAYEKQRKGEALQITPPWVTTAQDPATGEVRQVINDPWAGLRDKKQGLAKATVRPGALVNHWCADDENAPYLARWLVGVGTVTWVAQDLGSPSLVVQAQGRPPSVPGLTEEQVTRLGWAQVWDRVFDWPNKTINSERVILAQNTPQGQGMLAEFKRYESAQTPTPDLSGTLLKGMEHGGRGAGYVAIAVLFFLGYWVVAGPGSYFFLAARKRTHYSWVMFAACAGVATLLTVGIVKVVLRGAPEVKHVTFVRVAPGGEAVAHSNFGLYIPRDGMQEIELKETLPKRASYVTPYPMHPAHLPDQSSGGFVSYLEYDVPVRDRTSTEAAMIRVPYRSTLKKFNAKWVGQVKGTIAGRARVSGQGRLSGKLINETEVNLHSVYLVFMPTLDSGGRDPVMIQIVDNNEQPAWPAGQVLDLSGLEDRVDRVVDGEAKLTAGSMGFFGRLNFQWSRFRFHPSLRGGGLGADDAFSEVELGALLMTVFDLVEPSKVDENKRRYELRRRAGRHLDASDAVSTGHMLVFARSQGPLPFPMRVAGDEPVASEGVNYWQIIVPIDRPTVAPSTRPSTQPSTQSNTPSVNVEKQ